ncbi:hypothetical protein ACJMK2_043417 [Sinanodonta woodiana]|uniref:Mucosa-associated lymphoid tissue lymphoma translocation protein 1 n=1 Tax=Sinanodonta woodiana TaxID=1069815 RepID=A0ABD3VZN7_SINWO
MSSLGHHVMADVDQDGGILSLPSHIYADICDCLNKKVSAANWRALVELSYPSYTVSNDFMKRLEGEMDPANELLIYYSSRGMSIGELLYFLDQLKVDKVLRHFRSYEPVVIRKEPVTEVDLVETDNLCLEVKASGFPNPRYQWYWCGDRMNNFVPLKGQTDAVLHIANVSKENAGGYSCQIWNSTDPKMCRQTRTSMVCIQDSRPPSPPSKQRFINVANYIQQSRSSESSDIVAVDEKKENIYHAADKVALLIGNGDYRNEKCLQAPNNDVVDFAKTFRYLGFKVVSLLNLTKYEIEMAVEELCCLLGENVYIVFYFCGHGFEECGRLFLVPTDAPADYGTEDCICADAVLYKIQMFDPVLVLMILDTCRTRSGKTGCSDQIDFNDKETKRKGNTVILYATSEGLEAFENPNGNHGLLVTSLNPMLKEKKGIDAVLSEFKEAFSRQATALGAVQIPEQRSNLTEPRRSLADNICTTGYTTAFRQRSLRWQSAHSLPERKIHVFEATGVKVELEFQSDVSNILCIVLRVLDNGHIDLCTAMLQNFPPTLVVQSAKESNSLTGSFQMKYTIFDLQRLKGSNLTVNVAIIYRLRYGSITMIQSHDVDLGRPLISAIELGKTCVEEASVREPTQNDEMDSITKYASLIINIT